MPYRTFLKPLSAILLILPLFLSAPSRAADAPLSAGELDALVAPVALYPDQLLAKLFIGSTYPLEVVEAARWVDSNSSLKGSALENGISKQSWDDSIKSLAHVPAVIKMMNDRLDWTQKLGDAFLAQQNDVMDAVQRLRALAQKNGTLKSTSQQKVEVQEQTIVIEPVQPEVVYVPYYNPQTVYGAWAYPAYPPYYWPPPPGYAYGSGLAAGIGFVTGVAITAAFWNNAFNWNNHNVFINNNINVNNFNRYNNFNNVNNFNNRTNINNRNNVWNHDPAHRRGVNYANNNTRQKYGKGTLPGADARRDFRGFDNNNSRGLGNRNNGLNDRGGLGNRSSGLNDRSGGFGDRGNSNLGNRNSFDRGGMDRSSFGQGGRGGGFDGVGNGGSTRQFSNRGRSSMSGGFSGSRGGMRGGGGRRH